MAVRPDGATRGDLAEATALVIGGVVLLPVPLLVFFDRLASGWLWGSLVFAGVGLVSATVGLRWFLVEGPPLVAVEPDTVKLLQGSGPVDLPLVVHVVEARSRLIAHTLRFAAIGSGALLIVVSLGPLKWVVLALFGASFVADQTLLRPHRWVIDADGLRRDGIGSGAAVAWTDVGAVFWKHYPTASRPPFPSGERVIIERSGGDDFELVFHRRQGGTDAGLFVRAIAPLVGGRLKVLLPRVGGDRPVVESSSVGDMLQAPSASDDSS